MMRKAPRIMSLTYRNKHPSNNKSLQGKVPNRTGSTFYLFTLNMDPVASTRLSLQWPPAEAYEDTDTLVLTSSDEYFVDLRVLKNPPPESKFPLDWVLTGREKCLSESPLSIEFQHEINTHVEGNTGGPYDTGHFEDLENQDRKETGNMLNLETGKSQDYVEIWRTIDSLKSTPNNYVAKLDGENQVVPVLTLKVDNEAYLGTIVRIGNFLQGAILNLETKEVSCTRVFLKDGTWEVQFAYGDESSKIPIDGAGETVENEGLKWKVVEKKNF